MQKFNSVDELVNTVRPVDPIYCIRPNSIKSACSWFKSNFPGQILYAVKTNPNENVIKYIGESGINRFDVASINEIKLIKKLFPKTRTYYMNSIKSREHIHDAYFNYKLIDSWGSPPDTSLLKDELENLQLNCVIYYSDTIYSAI